MNSSNGSIFSRLRSKMGSTRKTEQNKNEAPRKQGAEDIIKLKIVLTGESGTGAKTSFLRRYVKNEFPDFPEPTIGAAFMTKNIDSRGKNVKLELWDTAGQKGYNSLLPMYLKDADGIVAGYDITKSASIDDIREKLPYIRSAPPDSVIMVIGNKVDLAEEHREVSREEGEEFAREIGAQLFFETSAKTGHNVNESMEVLVDKILEVKGY